MKAVLSFDASLTTTFHSGILNPRRPALHHGGMQSKRTLTSERRTTASQNARFFSRDRLGKAGVARHVLEIVAGNHDVPREVDDLRAHQGGYISVRWRRDESCRVVMLQWFVEDQGALVVDSDDCELFSVPVCPLFCGSNANAVSNSPTHEMGIVHQFHLLIPTSNRISKEAPSPDQLTTIDINHGIIARRIGITPKRTRTKLIVHCPIILDVNECILLLLQIHVPLPMSFHHNVPRTKKGVRLDLRAVVPLHASPDDQCSDIEISIHLEGCSEGYDADGIVPALIGDH
mmetsp:Transcript_11745/g.25229  ORF Transcript_11745/g.25229 Transcript_11745/m.25229 type:complete len:289 (-) Transcript_11745:478-1344(-)